MSRPNPQALATAGFTLLELLVVVAIIGLLAAYAGPRYFGQIGKSEQAVARSQVEGFHRALAGYRLDMGSFPSSEEGLASLTGMPPTAAAGAATWRGPYLSKAVPLDPWGRPYIYRNPGVRGDYDLLSYGKDGQPGGSGDAADIGPD
nr:type II secretion system major pseudopilin GspG [Ramlibacter aurantiacus]